MNDPLKDELLALLREIWDSAELKFADTPRSRALRRELLTRALATLMTDDERAQLHGLPKGCRMRENAKILSRDKLVCGEYVWIGEGVIVDASGGLDIGEHTTLGSGCFIWSHSSAISNIMMNNSSGNRYIVRAKTRIGKGCFMGGPSVVYPGVTIGDKVVVMPMSVVTADVPSYSVVGGAPATVRRMLSEKAIQRMKRKLDAEAGASV